jgi:hypothetical protein
MSATSGKTACSIGSQESGYDAREFAAFDVRFDPDVIHGLVETATEPEPALCKSARRGAKRKDWWDILWIEMIRRIQAGTLNPNSPAELQRILEDYTSGTLNQEYGDSTLKPMASNLFKYLQEIGGK